MSIILSMPLLFMDDWQKLLPPQNIKFEYHILQGMAVQSGRGSMEVFDF
jgi:hypothetical protein